MRLPPNLFACAALLAGAGVSARTANTPAAAPPGATNSPAQLSTVVVTSELNAAREQIAPSLGAVTYTIGPSQIEAMGQGENAPFQQVLLQAPGVVEDEFGEVHVRGDHGDIQYRLNGVLLPESLNGFAQELDTRLIHSVTLITGTLPSEFGFRTAGIIDVTSQTGAQLNGNEFSLYGGSYDTFHPSLQLGGATNKLDYFLTLSYLHDNVGIDNTTPSGAPLHDATDQEKAFGYFSYHFDPTSRLTLLLSGSYAGFQIPDTPGLSPGYSDSLAAGQGADSSAVNEFQTERNYYAALLYQKYLGALSFQVSGLTRYTDIRFTPDPVRDLLFGGVAAEVVNNDFANGLQADASYELGDSHTLRAGVLATHDAERLSTDVSVFPSGSTFAPNPADDNLPEPTPQSSATPFSVMANSENDGWTDGVYLQDEWRLIDPLTLNYGARYDRFDTSFDHEWQLSPRANLAWKINQDTSAHAGYARYFMPPTLQHIPLAAARAFEDTTDAPFSERDDPQKCERDNYFDMGVSRRLAAPWQVTLDGFWKLARNLLDDGQFGNAVILNNFNYSKGSLYGAELGSTFRQGPFSAYGNFSYVQTWAQNIDSAEFEFPDNELAYLSDHAIQLDHQGRYSGSGGVAYALWTNTRLHGDFLYGNGLRAGFANLEKLPAYATFNLGVEQTLPLRARMAGLKEWKLRFDCLNVMDEVYELRNGTGLGIAAPAYGPRRAFFGGLTAVW